MLVTQTFNIKYFLIYNLTVLLPRFFSNHKSPLSHADPSVLGMVGTSFMAACFASRLFSTLMITDDLCWQFKQWIVTSFLNIVAIDTPILSHGGQTWHGDASAEWRRRYGLLLG